MELTYQKMTIEETGTEYVSVDAYQDCGRRFYGVAQIWDLDNPNPAISIRAPLGVGAVKRIIKDVESGVVAK